MRRKPEFLRGGRLRPTRSRHLFREKKFVVVRSYYSYCVWSAWHAWLLEWALK